MTYGHSIFGRLGRRRPPTAEHEASGCCVPLETYDAEEIKNMSLFQLRHLLKQGGVTCGDCQNKDHYLKKALELAGKDIGQTAGAPRNRAAESQINLRPKKEGSQSASTSEKANSELDDKFDKLLKEFKKSIDTGKTQEPSNKKAAKKEIPLFDQRKAAGFDAVSAKAAVRSPKSVPKSSAEIKRPQGGSKAAADYKELAWRYYEIGKELGRKALEKAKLHGTYYGKIGYRKSIEYGTIAWDMLRRFGNYSYHKSLAAKGLVMDKIASYSGQSRPKGRLGDEKQEL